MTWSCILLHVCSVSSCPLAEVFYIQTGDISNLPLLCHYPVKVHEHKSENNHNRIELAIVSILPFSATSKWLRLITIKIVQAQFVKNDPDYLSCKKKECKKYEKGKCVVTTCAGSLTFHAINIRTDIEFVFFAGGFKTPCILTRSNPVSFATPEKPLYGHLSSIDSTGASVSKLITILLGYKADRIGSLILCSNFSKMVMNADEINMGQRR